MPKTARDVVERALRRIRVVSNEIPMEAGDFDNGKSVLDALLVELSEYEDMPDLADSEDIPDYAFLPLAQLLAEELAPDYNRPKPQLNWNEAMRRLRRNTFKDDRATDLNGPRFY